MSIPDAEDLNRSFCEGNSFVVGSSNSTLDISGTANTNNRFTTNIVLYSEGAFTVKYSSGLTVTNSDDGWNDFADNSSIESNGDTKITGNTPGCYSIRITSP